MKKPKQVTIEEYAEFSGLSAATIRRKIKSGSLSCSSPLVFNSDQGAQFTSEAFTARLESANIRIGWTGAGSVFDNIFIEQLWRIVKYEHVYLHQYDSVHTA